MADDYGVKFKEFHERNPEVYRELTTLARQALSRGKRRIGIKMIWEVVRWNRWLATTDEEFKLNNNYHSRYARLIMEQESDLKGIFALRELKTGPASVEQDASADADFLAFIEGLD